MSNSSFTSVSLLESQQLLEAAPIAIVGVDQAGQILFVNGRLEEMFGYRRSELVGHPIECLMPARFHQTHIAHRDQYAAAPRTRAMGSGMNLVAQRKDGTEFPIEVGLSYVETSEGLVIIGSITDITIRKELADMLEQRVKQRTQEIEQRRRVADGLRDTLTVLNSNKSLAEILDYIVNQAIALFSKASACAIYRISEDGEQFVLQTSVGLPSDYLETATKAFKVSEVGQSILARRPILIENLANTPVGLSKQAKRRRQTLIDGGHRAVLAVPLLINDQVYGSLMLYYPEAKPFSDEEVALAVTFSDQAALVIENARLRTQAQEAAVTAERNRLARDLHDSVTQTLFSASVIADVLPRLWDTNRVEGQRRSQELRELTRGALAEMRTLLLELRPAKLVEIPLTDLLKQLTEAIIGRARVPIELEITGECTMPPDTQIALYRTAQEALNNVAKHARASQAKVTLNCQPGRLELMVSDNGVGFTPDEIKPKNLGLTIMKERTEGIGARLDIKSKPGQGTRVKVMWKDKTFAGGTNE